MSDHITDPDIILFIVSGKVKLIGSFGGIEDRAETVMVFQPCQQYIQLSTHFFPPGRIFCFVTIEFQINDRGKHSFKSLHIPDKIFCLGIPAGVKAEKMVGAYPQSGFPGFLIIVSKAGVHMGAAFRSLDKGKRDFLLRENRPVNLALIF